MVYEQLSGQQSSNIGKWDDWYRDLIEDGGGPTLYGDAVTYLMASAFLSRRLSCGGLGMRPRRVPAVLCQ